MKLEHFEGRKAPQCCYTQADIRNRNSSKTEISLDGLLRHASDHILRWRPFISCLVGHLNFFFLFFSLHKTAEMIVHIEDLSLGEGQDQLQYIMPLSNMIAFGKLKQLLSSAFLLLNVLMNIDCMWRTDSLPLPLSLKLLMHLDIKVNLFC